MSSATHSWCNSVRSSHLATIYWSSTLEQTWSWWRTPQTSHDQCESCPLWSPPMYLVCNFPLLSCCFPLSWHGIWRFQRVASWIVTLGGDWRCFGRMLAYRCYGRRAICGLLDFHWPFWTHLSDPIQNLHLNRHSGPSKASSLSFSQLWQQVCPYQSWVAHWCPTWSLRCAPTECNSSLTSSCVWSDLCFYC